MGFQSGVAITDDSDFWGIAGEQQMQNLIADASISDFSALHQQAVNEIMRSLRGLGIDPTKVTNTDDFKAEAVYWVLRQVWRAEAAAGRGQSAVDKALMYHELWQSAVASRVIETDDGMRDGVGGVPVVFNQDSGSWFPGDDNGGNVTGRGEIGGFDDAVRNKAP